MGTVFLTVEQAAKRLQVAPYTLREWIKRGKLRAFRPGRAWRIPETALDELENMNSTDSSAAMHVVETIRARDERLSKQRKPRGTNVAKEIDTMRDERLTELSA